MPYSPAGYHSICHGNLLLEVCYHCTCRDLAIIRSVCMTDTKFELICWRAGILSCVYVQNPSVHRKDWFSPSKTRHPEHVHCNSREPRAEAQGNIPKARPQIHQFTEGEPGKPTSPLAQRIALTDPFFPGRSTPERNGTLLIACVPGRKVSRTTWPAARPDLLCGCSWTLPPTDRKENAAAGLPSQRRSRLAAKAQSSSPGLTLNASRALGSQVL